MVPLPSLLIVMFIHKTAGHHSDKLVIGRAKVSEGMFIPYFNKVGRLAGCALTFAVL
jgi:hypothetical protein